MQTQQKNQKFKILVRLRPQLTEDYKTYKKHQIINSLQSSDTTITLQRKNNQLKTFKFNSVFNPGQQYEIYEQSENLVDYLFQGYNSTFLAYGQTGTGKTHTIFGNESTGEQGYFYNTVKDIFTKIKNKMHTRQFAVRVSFVQFYLDNVYDLIANDNKVLHLFIQFLETLVEIKRRQWNLHQITYIIACKILRIAVFVCWKSDQTKKNRINLNQQKVIQKSCSNTNNFITKMDLRWRDQIYKRIFKNCRFGRKLKSIENIIKRKQALISQKNQQINHHFRKVYQHACHFVKIRKVNQQLCKFQFNLTKDLVNKFNFNKSYIPFRDSKITRFLSDSLDGKSRITLCVCVSKYLIHIQQTFSSLLFASQASTLKIDSKRNQVITLTPDKSKFQTPSKLDKNTVRKTTTPMKSSTQTSQNSIRLDYYGNREQIKEKENSNHASILALKQKQKIRQNLLLKFRTQIDDIDYYLKTRQIRNCDNITPQKMKQNLNEMNKIFNLYSKTSSFSNSKTDLRDRRLS